MAISSDNLFNASDYINSNPYIVSAYAIFTAACNTLLMRIIWKRCIQCETFILQNIILTGIAVADMTSALGVVVTHSLKDDSKKHSKEAWLYFLVTPALMIQEIHIVLLTINRYMVCIYGLVYPLIMTRWRLYFTILAVWVTVYLLLTAALLGTGQGNISYYSTSHSTVFKFIWGTAQLSLVLIISVLNIHLYYFAKKKLKSERRIVPFGMENGRKNEDNLLARNLKRTTGTVLLTLFYSIRILPHAVLKLVTVWTSNKSVEIANELAFLTELCSSCFDPIVPIVTIKIVRDGLVNEWRSIQTAFINFTSNFFSEEITQ